MKSIKYILTTLFLSILLVVIIGIRSWSEFLHEVMGVVLVIAIVVHLLLNRQWFIHLHQGSWNVIRGMQACIAFLLILDFLIVTITGVVISNYVFYDWKVHSLDLYNIFIRQLHASASYGLMILVGLHMGLHWSSLWQILKKVSLFRIFTYKKWVRHLFLLVIIVSGILGSYWDRVGDRLLGRHIFGTVMGQLPLPIYMLLLLAIMGTYVIIAYYIQNYYLKKRD